MFRIIFLLLLIFSFFTAVGAFVPDKITSGIDNAIIYFLTSTYAWNNIINISTFLTCVKILLGFFIGLMTFVILKWIMNLVS